MTTRRDRRRYTEIRVRPEVHVSSTGDYHVWVHVGKDGEGRLLSFTLNDRTFWNEDREYELPMPKYVLSAVLFQIVEAFDVGDLGFYETDAEGRKRDEELRYYDPEWMAEWMTTVKGEFARGEL